MVTHPNRGRPARLTAGVIEAARKLVERMDNIEVCIGTEYFKRQQVKAAHANLAAALAELDKEATR